MISIILFIVVENQINLIYISKSAYQFMYCFSRRNISGDIVSHNKVSGIRIIYIYLYPTNTKCTISNKVRLTCWHEHKN